MEKIFETLKVQMSVPTTSSPNKNSPTKPLQNLPQNNAGYLHQRRSQNVNTSTVKKQNVKADRNKNNSSPTGYQKRENNSPVEILFQAAQIKKIGSTTNHNNSRGSPNNRGRENRSPPNGRSPANRSSPNYAGPKCMESPSPRSLPLPPLHWLQASRQVAGYQTQTSPCLPVHG
jgi:hypothetical protein